MARCPNCALHIAWDATECGACQAAFTEGSAWKIEPETWEERQKLERRYAAAAAQVPAQPASPPARPQLVLGFCLLGGLLLSAFTFAASGGRGALVALIAYGTAVGGAGLLALVLRSGAMATRAGLLVLGGIFAGLGAAVWDNVPAEPSRKFSSTWEPGVDRRDGVRYGGVGIRGGYATVCANECGKDPRCAAWTMQPAPGVNRAECIFMLKAGSPRSDACCVSGVISRE